MKKTVVFILIITVILNLLFIDKTLSIGLNSSEVTLLNDDTDDTLNYDNDVNDDNIDNNDSENNSTDNNTDTISEPDYNNSDDDNSTDPENSDSDEIDQNENSSSGDSQPSETPTVIEEHTTEPSESPTTPSENESVEANTPPVEPDIVAPPKLPSIIDTLNKENAWSNKTVYLTFDDGPSSLTTKVLDLLRKENIKATFFVIGTNR